MADLLTHVLVGHICKRLSPWPAEGVLFAVGSVLPDLAGRVPRIALDLLDPTGAWALPPMAFDVWSATHTPLTYLVLCLLLALWCPLSWRHVVWRNLALGGLLHLGLDFFQTHINPATYRYLFPFSFAGWELGWVGTEESLAWIPWLVPVALFAEGRYRWRRRISPAPT